MTIELRRFWDNAPLDNSHPDDSPPGQLPTRTTPHQDNFPLGQLSTTYIPIGTTAHLSWWCIILVGNCPDGELSNIVGNCPGGQFSWWGVVIPGGPPKNGTVDFQDFTLINSYLFSLCWIEHLFLIIITPRSSNLVRNFLFYE